MPRSVGNELRILQHIKDACADSESKTHLLNLRARFSVGSGYTKDVCLVTDVLGKSLKEYLVASGGKVSVPVAKNITTQLLTALSKLHSAGIVHTGKS